MNRIYRIIWSAATGTWVVASELAKSRQKTSKLKKLSLLAGVMLAAPAAYADPAPKAIPVLNNIASGTAIVTSNTSTGRLTVDQSSAKLIANWHSFNVGEVARVTFNQPDANSIALNRIAATAPSEIFGKVLANGKLILVNPAGMVIGINGQISASSVVASTMNISDSNFNSNVWLYERGTATGTIDNRGIILSNDGNTSVLASSISNSGTIRAKSGNTVLANGNRVTLDNTSAVLNQVSSIASYIQSTGILRADRLLSTKGKVYLIGDRARAASLVELEGELTAISADIKGRQIYITGNLDSIANTTLNAVNSINIDGALSIIGNNRLVSFSHGLALGEGYFLGLNGKVNLPGINTKFRVNGDYYTIIKTLSELQAVGASTTNLAGKYALGLDVDASSTAVSVFTPIGSVADPFTGVLDGLGHAVNSLTINTPAVDGVGLLGAALNSTIRNVSLNNANIIGKNYVGGLVAEARSSSGDSFFSNNHVTGSVKGKSFVGGLIGFNPNDFGTTTLDFSGTNATVSGNSNVGGLIGFVDADESGVVVTQSNVQGITQVPNVLAESKFNIGGLIGGVEFTSNTTFNLNNSQVSGAVNSPRVSTYVGGAIGRLSSSFSMGSYATIDQVQTGGVVSVNTGSSITGGLVGGLEIQDGNGITIVDSSATGNVSGGQNVGGLIGTVNVTGAGLDTVKLIVDNSNAAGKVTGTYYVGGLIGASDSYGDGAFVEIGNGTYATGQVSATSYVGGLIGSNTNEYNGSQLISNTYATGKVNATATESRAGGLIGNNESYFGLSNIVEFSSATGRVTGDSRVGGLIGYNAGQDATAITINSTDASGIVTGVTEDIGGLVGRNVARIQDSHATGNVLAGSGASNVGGLVGQSTLSVLQNNYSSGNLSGGFTSIGGLLGYSYQNSITGSYASGAISTSGGNVGGLVGLNYYTPIQNSYASGNVSSSPSYAIGGLVGYNYDSGISNSYATGIVSGYGNVGGLVGTNQINTGYTISFYRNYASGNVNANSDAGGLIGSNQVNGTLSINQNYASGNVSTAAGSFLGGLIGYHNSNTASSSFQIIDSFASGSTTGNEYLGGLIGGLENQSGVVDIINTYAKGNVTGTGGILGGLIGYVNDTAAAGFTNISNSYWDITGTGQSLAIGNAHVRGIISNLTGLTGVQAKQAASYGGWDISTLPSGSSSVWYINQNVNTPQLRALLP